MPEIREGLEIEGKPVSESDNDSFETFVAGQASKGAPAAPKPKTLPNPATDSAKDIARGLLETSASNQIPDGLTVETPPKPEAPVLEPIELSESDQALVKQAGRELEQDKRDLAEARGVLHQQATERFWTAVDASEGNPELFASAVAQLKLDGRVSDAEIGNLLVLAAQDLSGYDADNADDAERQEFANLVEAIDEDSDARVEQVLAIRKAGETAAVIQHLTPKVAEERAQQYHSLVKQWVQDVGIRSDEEANARLAAADAFAREELGIDLMALMTNPEGADPEGFVAVLRACDAANAEEVHGNATRDFQNEILGAETKNVGDGIEQRNAFGEWTPLNVRELGPAELDEDAVVRRSQARHASAKAIRESVAEPSGTSVSAGLTGRDGKALDVDTATGAKERFRQEREADAARTRGLLR